MRIDKKYQLEKVASKDETRLIITGICAKNGRAIATNGCSLVSVPVAIDEEDGTEDVVIPKALFAVPRPKRI